MVTQSAPYAEASRHPSHNRKSSSINRFANGVMVEADVVMDWLEVLGGFPEDEPAWNQGQPAGIRGRSRVPRLRRSGRVAGTDC